MTQPDFKPAKEKLGIGEASKSHIDVTERPVGGDREEARVYKGELLFSGKRRMRSFSGLFVLQLTALIATVFQPLCALVFLLLWAILYMKSVATRYWIYERRIDIKTGVLLRQEHSIWIYEIDETWLTRSPLNLLTGDATVHIQATMTHKTEHWEITGLGNHKFMKRLWEELRDAGLVERRAMKRWWI